MVRPRQQSTVNGQREPPEQLLALARAVLDSVMDPEVPVLSIVELGIVRQIELVPDPDTVRVTLTPTYSGCPAMHAIEAEIRSALLAAGFASVELKTVYAPAWTTDWISSPAREKLRAYGIAPPPPPPPSPPPPAPPATSWCRWAARGGRSPVRSAARLRRPS
ncbi:MAG TPA: 1,2-phenylacetyl-CoA epoxidase subunit PaaD [Gemmatimonadales bacterium]|nr:1,2-phenylacetyl-CoA epoxidase subunit PaaD [Gemmatimonadales bacterium]